MTGWRSPRGRPRGTPASRPPSSLLRGSTTPCQILVEDRQVLGAAPGQRADQRAGEGAAARSVRSPKNVAVQDRVLQHADLLGGGQRRLQLLVVAGRPRRPRRAGRRSSAAGCRAGSAARRARCWCAAQQLLGAEPDDLLLALLVGHHRDAHEVEAALERRGQVVDAAVAAVGGGDDREAGLGEDDVVARSSSGIETYFSDRIEISASCTSLVQRVSSSKRPIDARAPSPS